MTPKEFFENAKRVASEATPGPWHIGHVSESGLDYVDIDGPNLEHIAEVYRRKDQPFIASSRTQVPVLAEAALVMLSALERYGCVCHPPYMIGATEYLGDQCHACHTCTALARVAELVGGGVRSEVFMVAPNGVDKIKIHSDGYIQFIGESWNPEKEGRVKQLSQIAAGIFGKDATEEEVFMKMGWAICSAVPTRPTGTDKER